MQRQPMSSEEAAAAAAAHTAWLQDSVLFLLFLLVLDRFADYHNDTATAPVRETAAQALAYAVAALPHAAQARVQDVLIGMQPCPVWEVNPFGPALLLPGSFAKLREGGPKVHSLPLYICLYACLHACAFGIERIYVSLA